MKEQLTQLFGNHGLRKTDIREQVLKIFLKSQNKALSNQDIENQLKDIDRITLYRTLKIFERKGLIHQAIDSSGIGKYALCHASCTEEEHQDDHAHFHCYSCGATICIAGRSKAQVRIPHGFKVEKAHIVLEGICANCSD